MTAASRPPDDTPPFHDDDCNVAYGRCNCRLSGKPPVAPDDTPLSESDVLEKYPPGFRSKPVAPDDTSTRLIDFKYAIALIEDRIPVEGPANREPLRQRVERLKSYAKPSELEAELRAEVSRLREAHDRLALNGAAIMVWLDAPSNQPFDSEWALNAIGQCIVRARESALRQADVSRLQQENDRLKSLECSCGATLETLHRENDRVHAENALLRRSLEMLTKQLDERDRADEDARYVQRTHD
jgi:hypothetical protein